MRYVVLGSNLGWQSYFAALMFGVEVDGYEIVPHRYNASVEFATRHEVTAFVQSDLLAQPKPIQMHWPPLGPFRCIGLL